MTAEHRTLVALGFHYCDDEHGYCWKYPTDNTWVRQVSWEMVANLAENLRDDNTALLRQIDKLTKALEEANLTIEDVCTGGRLECPKCGKPRPCLCLDTGPNEPVNDTKVNWT